MRPALSNYRFQNWDRTLSCKPRRFYQPSSEAEVCEIVRETSRATETVRVVGAGHSWSPLVSTDDNIVNLDHLNQLIGVDDQRMQVTVGAGIRLKELNELLPRYGLALANLGSIAEQSIAGAISTGTHGTGIRFGNLSTQIVAMNLIAGGGRLVRLTQEGDPELLDAARVSLGALGIITQVTIQCVRAHPLLVTGELQPFERVLNSIEQICQENERVRLYWFSGMDSFYIMTINPTDRPVTPPHPIRDRFNGVTLRHDLMAFFLRLGRSAPALVESINRLQASIGFQSQQSVERSDHALTIPMPPRHQETEYAIPVEKTAEAIRLTRKMIEQDNYKTSMPLEVRFTAADQSMLSPSYGRNVCYLGAYAYGEELVRPYFDEFERQMKKLGGRPHWGKRFTLTAEEARKMYPRYDRFHQIRKEMDPSGIFANKLIKEIFR